jgi:outer membrane protein assembly factor BamD
MGCCVADRPFQAGRRSLEHPSTRRPSEGAWGRLNRDFALLRQFKRLAPVLLMVVVSAAAVSACQTNNKSKVLKQRQAYQERPVEVLYNIAATLTDAGAFDNAVQYFREVERQHPYSEWARRSIMMEAYAEYREGNFPDAQADADRFIQLYPGNPTAAYAYYLKALTYFDQMVEVGRDQGDTATAQAALREIVRRFPGTPYARDADLKLNLVDDQLAGKEMNIGRFYLRGGRTLAAINRFKNVIDHYQTTNQIPEALYRLVEANLTLGVVDEAQRNAAVLGVNYPGSQWYTEAYGLMTDKGLKPTVQPVVSRRLTNGFGLFGGGRARAPAADTEVKIPKGTALPPPK